MKISDLKNKEMISKLLIIGYLIILILFIVLEIIINNNLFRLILLLIMIVLSVITYIIYNKSTIKKEDYLLLKSVSNIDSDCYIDNDKSFPTPLKMNFGNFNNKTHCITKVKSNNFTLMGTLTLIEGSSDNDYRYTYTYDFDLDKNYDFKTIISYKNNYFIKNRENKITSGDEEFDSYFDIYSNTNIDNEIIEIIKSIKKYIYNDFVIYYEKNKLYIFVFSRMDYLGAIRNNKIEQAENRFSREVNLFTSVYEEIKKRL